jgi:Tol biopolymer transport system component
MSGEFRQTTESASRRLGRPTACVCALLVTALLVPGCRDRSMTEPPPPAEPRIAFVSNRDGNPEIYSMRIDGTDVQRLTDHPAHEHSPSWSPDRRWIAFVSDRGGDEQIHVMRSNGTGVQRLTAGPRPNRSPAWSSDGRSIAFVGGGDGDEDIYLMNADGSGVRPLVQDAWRDFDPAWSPNGRRLAFTSTRDGVEAIFVIDVDGSGLVRLSPADQPRVPEHSPAWSPGGDRILFVRDGRWSLSGGGIQIHVMNADGTGRAALTASEEGGFFAVDPAWSADGNRIVFTSDRGGLSPELFVMNSDGSGITRLSANPEPRFYVDPAWSPDGRWIAFVNATEGSWGEGIGNIPATSRVSEIYLVGSDGNGLRRLVGDPAPARYADPVWSPDASKIAFTDLGEDRFCLACEIYVVNADGSSRINVTNHPADDRSPVWAPDGKEIAFASRRDGDQQLYVVRPDGSGLTRLTSVQRWAVPTDWSADGARILFHASPDSSWYQQIHVVNRVGGGITQLTTQAPRGTARAVNAKWSPHGDAIAYVSDPYSQPGTPWSVFIMNPDGGAPRPLTGYPLLGSGSFHAVIWSPDGTRMAADARNPESYAQSGTLILGRGGDVQARLADGFCRNADRPSWNPAGDRVLFLCSDIRGRVSPRQPVAGYPYYPFLQHDLYIHDLISGRLARLTHGSPFSAEPAWSD